MESGTFLLEKILEITHVRDLLTLTRFVLNCALSLCLLCCWANVFWRGENFQRVLKSSGVDNNWNAEREFAITENREARFK